MIGETVAHYRITARLGQGGMGVVYEAEDLRLPRRVALKFLAAEQLHDASARERFEREARAASVLSHPHICVLHDLVEHDGKPFLVMERLHGRTLREKLADGPLPAADVLWIGSQVADALEAAHAAGIVHRDVKPANIFVTDRGDAKVLDFGVAGLRPQGKDAATEVPTLEKLTTPGTAVGTVAYMSPEQVLGRDVDGRSDIFSLGVVLYEMATGALPFAGDSAGEMFDAILHKTPTSPVRLNAKLPVELERVIGRCLEKDAFRRWGSAAELRQALARASEALEATGALATVVRRWARDPRAWIVTGLAIVALVGVFVVQARHRTDVRWAREQALPRIRALIETSGGVHEGNLEAYRLAERAERFIPGDTALKEAMAQLSATDTFVTEPPGATVWIAPYQERESWQHLGETPLRDVRLPTLTTMRWRVEKAGFVPILRSGWFGTYDEKKGAVVSDTFSFKLVAEGSQPPDMTRVDGTDEVPEFLVDRHEVTNRDFKAFVDAGGYRERRYWKHDLTRDERTVEWAEAMRRFVDRTGRPGPATWEAGSFPEGQGEFPVGGVSWYEAAAFAEFAGKSLPTLDHWWAAAGRVLNTEMLIGLSNFSGQGPTVVGSSGAITAYGAADMAGNVREWCWNRSSHGHCLRGGAWNDQTYMFGNVTEAPAFDRSETNGFRCVQYLGVKTPSDEQLAAYRDDSVRDFSKEKRVSNDVFAAYVRLFDYDARELQARVEARDDSAPDWIRERVSFSAAYGDERVVAQLFLPRSARPPYQTVVYFPGSNAIQEGPSDEIGSGVFFRLYLGHLVKSGRALLYPVYKGTHERNEGKQQYYRHLHVSGAPTQEYVAYWVKITQDLRRSFDYLASRPDIDGRRVAYYGFSWGGFVAPVALAVEDRFRAAILAVGGLDCWDRPRAEIDASNYAPHVRLPVLMLNGRHDLVVPLESSARPLFDLLGTSPSDKALRIYESDHAIPRTELIRESLAWLDRYLGPVEPAAVKP